MKATRELTLFMVIHASNQFSKWFRCRVSLRGQAVAQGRLLNHWSTDIVQLNTKRLALMMNDASLWSIIVPMEKFMTQEQLLKSFLQRVAEVWAAHGAPFDPGNQSLYFLKRGNRTLIGSMNDAIHHIRCIWQDERPALNCLHMEKELNRKPFGALNYDSPDRVMRRMLGALA